MKNSLIKNDALRLAAICELAPPSHRVEKNFLIAVSTASSDLFEQRTEEITQWLDEYEFNVGVNFQPVDLSFHLSRKEGRTKDKPLHGGIWQFKHA